MLQPRLDTRPAWKAELALSYRHLAGRTFVAGRRHLGPLVVQRPLYPEGQGVCHSVLLHPPGGIAGGDMLSLDVELGDGARALLTTPAATKWYKSAGRTARQTSRFTILRSAVLEWLPQESIVFDEADAAIETTVRLDAQAIYAGWEIVCLGRRAARESFRQGALLQTLEIRRADRLIWNDRIALAGGDRLLASPAGLNGHHVAGAMAVAAPSPLPADLLDACRAVPAEAGEGRITSLPAIVSARYLGDSAERAKDYFEALRAVLRPWYAGLSAERPRIWYS